MEHEDSDSYDGEVEVSVNECSSDTSMSEAEITDSNSDSAVDIQQALQWVGVKTSGLPHNTKHLSRAQDNSE
jgi:hypothetical protein